VHEIDDAVGQSNGVENVVHLALGNLAPDSALDKVAQLRGLFDPRAALGAEMEDELAVIRARKEILTEPRHKEKNRSAGQKESRHKKESPVD
jgi:hypothetical protein